jgi:hypothetical protein
MSNLDICLNVLQATALANEVNLAKNLATTSINLINSNITTVHKLEQRLIDLCHKLSLTDISGDLPQDLYNSLNTSK